MIVLYGHAAPRCDGGRWQTLRPGAAACGRGAGVTVRLNGACLCGRVRYRIDGDFANALIYCHCSQCRKAQGVAFAANMPIPLAAFHLLSGADRLAEYRASPGKARYFCRDCGSPLYSRLDGGDTLRLRVGTLETGAPLVPVAHIYAPSHASWHEIGDSLPRYPGREPGRD